MLASAPKRRQTNNRVEPVVVAPGPPVAVSQAAPIAPPVFGPIIHTNPTLRTPAPRICAPRAPLAVINQPLVDTVSGLQAICKRLYELFTLRNALEVELGLMFTRMESAVAVMMNVSFESTLL